MTCNRSEKRFTTLNFNEFGKKDLGLLVGVVTAFEMLGAAIAAPLTGAIADKYDTYAPAWIILSVIGVIMLITLAISVVQSKKLVMSLESVPQKDFAVSQTI